MYAKELEHVFSGLLRKTDFHSSEHQDIETRFGALRSYGHLPQGREHRGRRLDRRQIGLAIFGLVPTSPAWAGHSASCLKNLVPVGGPKASAWGTESLLGAIEKLLADKSARDDLVRLTMTGAESGVNCHGQAEIVFVEAGRTKRAGYVSRMAISVHQEGAELGFDFDRRHAPVSREISFGPEFFRDLSYEIDLSNKLNRPPAGDGEEYDAEEALSSFYKSLGARNGSRFLNIGVEATIQWPRTACKFGFGAATIVAMPSSKTTDASLHIDLNAYGLSAREGRSLLSEALSISVWIDDQMAILLDGWAGNPVPVAVPRSTQRSPSSIINGWCNGWTRIDDERVRRLLGLYREARNLELTHSIPYALLGYYRIFENLWPNGKDRERRLSDMLEKTGGGTISDHERSIMGLKAGDGPGELANQIYNDRQMVAHARTVAHVNPDQSEDVGRISVGARLLRSAAREAMKAQTGIPTSRWRAT